MSSHCIHAQRPLRRGWSGSQVLGLEIWLVLCLQLDTDRSKVKSSYVSTMESMGALSQERGPGPPGCDLWLLHDAHPSEIIFSSSKNIMLSMRAVWKKSSHECLRVSGHFLDGPHVFFKTLGGALRKLLQILSGSGPWLLPTSPLGVLTGSGDVLQSQPMPRRECPWAGSPVSCRPARKSGGVKWGAETRGATPAVRR